MKGSHYTAATITAVLCAHLTWPDARATERSKCTARLQQFVLELEELLPHATGVAPVHLLFKKYFPLERCDPDEVLAICKKSRYCSDKSAHPSILVVVFDSRPNQPHSGLYVQFGVERQSGDTLLPFVKVKL